MNKVKKYIPKLGNAPSRGSWDIVTFPKIGDVIAFKIEVDGLCSVVGQVKSLEESISGLTKYLAIKVLRGAMKGKNIFVQYYYCGGNDSTAEEFYRQV
ncbi:MAG: hypothetical protein KAS32_22180 [Candidatus Peribacteraceae bacterium]|nr:hypothetical protein [Candidatus Peribacteraceae bacterium]